MILKSIKFTSLILLFIFITFLVLGSFTAEPPPADAQSTGNPLLCFTVSDGQNQLRYKNRFTGAETLVGGTGVLNIEALEMNLDNTFLYTVDDPLEAVHTDQGQFGHLANFLTAGGGDFTLIGAIPAAHNVLLGDQNLDDVDSLSIDARTNKLWGITQDPGNNLIFQLNVTNGDHVSDIFGVGYDYARIDLGVDTVAQTIRACGGGVINCGGGCPDTIDDLAIDPTTGTFYAIGNAISGMGVDYMMRLDVNGVDPANSPGFDPAQGEVFACAIDVLTLEATPGNFVTINDMEGFGVHNDGTFYGTTGSETDDPVPPGIRLSDSMYRIDPATATVFYLVPANPAAGNWGAGDTEGVTCLTAGSNLITGTVYLDADPTDNEQYKPGAGDVSQENVTVELYIDNNNNGEVDAGDTLIQTQQTGPHQTDPGNDGFYSFPVGITGNFAVRILPATLPTGAAMTTDNREEADFPNWGNLDPNNDYGFNFRAPLDLGISKDDGVNTYVPGGTLTYTIRVRNFGPGNAVNATVTDIFPPEFTSVSWTCVPSAGATCTAGPVNGNINDTVNIPANGVLVYTVVAQVSNTATGVITNTAGVDHPDDNNPNNDQDSDSDNPPANFDLGITKDNSVNTYVPGGTLTYTITVTNFGPDDAFNATVTDTFPPEFTSVTWTCVPSAGATCTAGPVTGDINDTVNIPANGTLTYTAVAQVSPNATGVITNTAGVDHPRDRDPNNNRDDDSDNPRASFDLGITKDDGVVIYVPGGTLTYTITVTNFGPDDAFNATVTDTFPPEFTSVTWTCVPSAGATCTAGPVTGDINDTVNIPANGTLTYTAVAQVSTTATGVITNTAGVDHPNDRDPNNNRDDDSDNPQTPGIDLAITKDDGRVYYRPGGRLVYQIVVTNVGTRDAVDARVLDRFPPELINPTWTCVASAGSTCTAGPVQANINDTVTILAGGTLTYTVRTQVDPNKTGDLTNTAVVDHPRDRDPNNNRDDDTDIPLTPGVDLAIEKDDGVVTYIPGGSLTYRIIVANVGTNDAVDATVTDIFPPHLINVSWTCQPDPGATCTAGPVQGNINDTVSIPSSAQIVYTVNATVSPDATGELLNTAEVTHPNDRDPGNNRDDDKDDPPGSPPPTPIYDLAITKQVNPPSALPGDVVTWTIIVTNTGNMPLTGVTVTDPVDPNFFSEIIDATTSKGTVNINGLNVTFNIGDLAVGESVTMTLVTRIKDGITSGTGTNTATATGNEIDGIRRASASVVIDVGSLPATGYPPSIAAPAESKPRYWLFGLVIGLGVVGLFALRRRR